MRDRIIVDAAGPNALRSSFTSGTVTSGEGEHMRLVHLGGHLSAGLVRGWRRLASWGVFLVFIAAGVGAGQAMAGSVFLTGHDPDFHASLGGNGTGAQNINKAAIT